MCNGNSVFRTTPHPKGQQGHQSASQGRGAFQAGQYGLDTEPGVYQAPKARDEPIREPF